IDNEKYSEARAYLDRIGHSGEDVEWLALAADVESGRGDLDAAARLYDEILKLRPSHRAALYNYSVILSDMDRHDEAMVQLETLVEVEGESAEVLNDL